MKRVQFPAAFEETFMSMIRTAERGSARPLVAAPASPLGRLGSWSYRHRRLVAVAWVVALVAVSLAGRLAGSQFKDNLNGGTATPSQQAAAFLQRNFPSQAGDVAQVVFQAREPVTSAAARDRIASTLAGIARLARRDRQERAPATSAACSSDWCKRRHIAKRWPGCSSSAVDSPHTWSRTHRPRTVIQARHRQSSPASFREAALGSSDSAARPQREWSGRFRGANS